MARRPEECDHARDDASITNQSIDAVAEVFESGDVIIDGGNTHYHHDDIRHARELGEAVSTTSTGG